MQNYAWFWIKSSKFRHAWMYVVVFRYHACIFGRVRTAKFCSPSWMRAASRSWKAISKMEARDSANWALNAAFHALQAFSTMLSNGLYGGRNLKTCWAWSTAFRAPRWHGALSKTKVAGMLPRRTETCSKKLMNTAPVVPPSRNSVWMRPRVFEMAMMHVKFGPFLCCARQQFVACQLMICLHEAFFTKRIALASGHFIRCAIDAMSLNAALDLHLPLSITWTAVQLL